MRQGRWKSIPVARRYIATSGRARAGTIMPVPVSGSSELAVAAHFWSHIGISALHALARFVLASTNRPHHGLVESSGLGAERAAEVAALPIPPDITDDELVALWLNGKSPHTIRAYGADFTALRTFTGKRLRATLRSDLQGR
jgi:hypothetical protein